ncbi:CRISPR-associated protein, Cse4 family [Nitrosomonas cryotolerans]|uniref:CRISPR system Cascade subunit CasC n=1 Tax=Nitrosomonas cryotolerans ATCC 49181 TaxID=1131553 RepID=A0A1N6GVT8_9PROT|nr:type I-E CRISPR-associated protein Cas7/Cse4/CasC [Nitrosomonas cryotolerans]SFP41598.1 CRISPR-associated protein, Cse4 family [Nitrosomonas cryotolerans]SIO11638.1 CRISPR system Cascade subunit CasC [Nitrosomonas cryotolerans ATCC 49181]
MNIDNPLKNLRIEFHILQSFPVTCLNRDDVGAPKTAIIGGVQRARVSSQAWKRPVRMAMHELGGTYGTRTKFIGKLISDACVAQGATAEQAQACGDKIEGAFIKKKEPKKPKKDKESAAESEAEEMKTEADSEKSDTLLFLSPNEVASIVNAFAEKGFNQNEVITKKEQKQQAKEISGLIKNVSKAIDAADIALFGRMVAQAADLSIEAAASFSHAISTHRVSNEIEFFTALDDLATEPGSAHMGILEFNSATYYRYVSLDLGQLYQTLAGQNVPEVVEKFTKALFVAVPAARQSTQSGASPWEFAKVLVRKGQRLQIPFETAIKAKNEGFIEPSIDTMMNYLAKQEKLHGSLFGKQAEYTYGRDDHFNIDDLITALKRHAAGESVREQVNA